MTEQHEDRDRIVESIRKNLVAFGYSDLTVEHVAAGYDRAMAGERPTNVIEMMVKSQLEENGLLPG